MRYRTKVGEISLGYETFAVNVGQGQSLTVYHAAPGSAGADALALPASHAATSAGAGPSVVLFNDYPERMVVAPVAPGTAAPSARTRPRS